MMMPYCERHTYGRSTVPQFPKKQNLFDQYIQMFEKPTIIYKTLEVRHKLLPLFLTRNLSYMHGRGKRPKKNALKPFKLDNMLNQVLAGKNKETFKDNHEYIILSAIEICSPSAGFKSANVDVYLLNCGVQEVASFYLNSSDKVYVGKCTNVPMVKDIPNQPTVVSTTLSLQMRKLYMNISRTKKWTFCFEVINEKEKFVSFLPLISTSQRCSLVAGIYEIPLASPGDVKLPMYDSIDEMKGVQILKVQLAWAKEPMPISLAHIAKEDDHPLISLQHLKVNEDSVMETAETPPQIQYTFVWGPKNEHQSTSLQPASVCPWCNLNCSQFYSMMKHLCVCHSRLNFVYKPKESLTHFVVEVTLNVNYDGSYEGNAWHLLAQPDKVFEGPQYCSSFTEFLVWRKVPQPPPSLSEFLAPSAPALPRCPNKIGHNRLYFHFGTWLPYVSPKEMVTESDNEGLDWHPEFSRQEMNDFTDVNDGEKAVMNEWNTFVSVNFKILAVNQVVPACQMFIQQCCPRLLNQRLYRNVLLHFVCLHDFGVLSATDLYHLVLELQQLAKSMNLESDFMETDDLMFDQSLLHLQSSNTKAEIPTLTSSDSHPKMIENMKQDSLVPNTHDAINEKDSTQSWETAYQYWLHKSNEEI